MAKGKFLNVKCKCGESHDVYSHSSTQILCNACKEKILEPTGGKAAILAQELGELEAE